MANSRESGTRTQHTAEATVIQDKTRSRKRLRLMQFGIAASLLTLILIGLAAWIGHRVITVRAELSSAIAVMPELKSALVHDDPDAATRLVEDMRSHVAHARDAANDPLWTMASSMPVIGPNLSAVAEISKAADDVVSLAALPLVKTFHSLNWDDLVPGNSGPDLESLTSAAPRVSAAANAVSLSLERLRAIDSSHLHPAVADALGNAVKQLDSAQVSLDVAADASELAPAMLGAEKPRHYLLLVQNNAELRATGGIPGALALLTVSGGKMQLEAQATATSMRSLNPPLQVDDEQAAIYSARLGKFMQDVNLTPDFPTAAETAKRMWEKEFGGLIDGVISVDPVALSYLLDATGPVDIVGPGGNEAAEDPSLTKLTSKNVVQTLLSDVYLNVPDPAVQDAYYASAAKEIFDSISSGKAEPQKLMEAISHGADERRILLWSPIKQEQSRLEKYPLGGSVTARNVPPAEFGVYFNDGTGAKMDYYVKRSVQLFKECTIDGYSQVKVRVKSTNTAPANAADALPGYVTGAGAFGVPAGTVQTNIVAYGPVQSNVETAIADGKKISFASQVHSGRPVGTVTVALPPGKSSTVEFTFGKIVQHTEPVLSVTPTVQAREDVVLDTEAKKCVPAA